MEEFTQVELSKGTRLNGGKYVLQRVIGAGGFGITYEATNTVFNSKCAIKEFFLRGHNVRHTGNRVSLQGMSTEIFEDSKKRFVDEAMMLYNLDHPNIVKVEDFFTDNGTEYMVMKYVEGDTLQKKIEKNGPMDEFMAVNYINQVLEALNYIHHKKNDKGEGLLHRDISPDNIIVTSDRGKDDKVVLIDFGNARRFVENKTQRQTSIVKHGFAPLEQYSNTSRKGAYSDLYSVGAVLYYLLTATIPATSSERGSDPGLFVEPIKKNPRISKSINAIIVKAMEMKPEDRYKSAEKMRDDIMAGHKPIRKLNIDKTKLLKYSVIIIGVAAVVFALVAVVRSAMNKEIGGDVETEESVELVEYKSKSAVLEYRIEKEIVQANNSDVENTRKAYISIKQEIVDSIDVDYYGLEDSLNSAYRTKFIKQANTLLGWKNLSPSNKESLRRALDTLQEVYPDDTELEEIRERLNAKGREPREKIIVDTQVTQPIWD
ncbi:MAG: serine/threonine protein kinase [Bacteroidales bacterium]|nr:serine/threonine protein kinase [Bacteroidales bacterium]